MKAILLKNILSYKKLQHKGLLQWKGEFNICLCKAKTISTSTGQTKTTNTEVLTSAYILY